MTFDQFPTYLSLYQSLHNFLFWFTTLLIHNSPLFLSLSFTLGLEPTTFTNPSTTVSLLPPGLPSPTIIRTVSFELIGCFCSFFLIFRFWCRALDDARLSWPSLQFFSARKHIMSYRIEYSTPLFNVIKSLSSS